MTVSRRIWSRSYPSMFTCRTRCWRTCFRVTVTPLFTSEYREGTDAFLLSSRNGRSGLVAAKIAAAALYATALFAVGVPLALSR